MANGKAHIFEAQNNYNYGNTFEAGNKAPIIADRIWDTKEDALGFVNDPNSMAVPGLVLSVISDGDNNGVYWVKKAAGYNGAITGDLQKLGEGGGGGGINSIDFSLDSDQIINDVKYAIVLTINGDKDGITADALKSSLGLKDLAYKQMSDVLKEFSEGDGLSYENGVYSLVSLHNGGTYPKITYDEFGRVTSGANLTESDIPSITISKISDLAKKLEEYVLVKDYDADINDQTDGLAAKVARLEQMFTFDEATGSIKTDYHFYSTKQIAGGGRPGAITNLVNVIPNYSDGVLVATINGTKIYAPASGGGVSVNPVYTSGNKVASINGVDIYVPESSGGDSGLWYESEGAVVTDSAVRHENTLIVNDDTYLNSFVQISGDLDIMGALCIESGAELYGCLSVYGSFNVFEYDAYIENNLIIEGTLDIKDLAIDNERGWEGSVLMCDSDGYPYWADLPAGSSITLATLATTYASGNLSAAITFASNDSYGIFTATNNYGSIGSSSKRFYCGYINNLYAYSALYIGGTTSYFNGKTTAIASTSTDYQIPSAKSVYDYVQANIGDSRWYAEGDELYLRDYSAIIEADLTVTGMTKLSQLYIPTSSGSTSYGAGSSGQVLMSNGTTVYWGTAPSGSNYTLPLASSSVRGGIKIGASGSSITGQYVDLAVALNSSEQAYVRLPKSAIIYALGYTPAQNGSSGDPSANPILTLASINGSTTTVPNGIISVEITSATTLSMKGVTPEDPSKTCVLYLVKCGTYSVSIPVVSTSGVVAVASSGTVATSTVSLAGYIGCILVWNSTNNNWVAYL